MSCNSSSTEITSGIMANEESKSCCLTSTKSFLTSGNLYRINSLLLTEETLRSVVDGDDTLNSLLNGDSNVGNRWRRTNSLQVKFMENISGINESKSAWLLK